MKRSLGLLSALVLTVSLAVGSAGVAEAAPGNVLTKPQLRAALLTVKDLPEGFKVDRSAEKSSDDDVQVLSDDRACEQALKVSSPTRAPGQVSAVESDFKRERDSGLHFSYEAATLGLTAFRSSAAVAKDFARNVPLLRSCHRVGLDMGHGTKMSLEVESKVRRINGHRTFAMSMHGRYLGVAMNLVMSVSQQQNYEVSTMLVGAHKSSSYVTKLSNTLRRAQTAKLIQHLR